MNTRLYTPIALLLFAGLGAAGCAEAIDDTHDTHQSTQELVLFSVQDDASDAQAMNLVYNQARGWHMTFTDAIQATNLPGTENLNLHTQPLDFDIDIDIDDDVSGGSTTRSKSPSRFNASLAGSSRFSASVPGAYGFSAGLAGSSTYSSSTPASYGFSSNLSTGGQCSLDGVCDFLATVCSFAPQSGNCSAAAISECRSGIRQAAAEMPPEAAPLMCALGNFFTCATSAITSGGNADAAMDRCGAELFGSLFSDLN